jgi:hypothetical protein
MCPWDSSTGTTGDSLERTALELIVAQSIACSPPMFRLGLPDVLPWEPISIDGVCTGCFARRYLSPFRPELPCQYSSDSEEDETSWCLERMLYRFHVAGFYCGLNCLEADLRSLLNVELKLPAIKTLTRRAICLDWTRSRPASYTFP